MKSWTKGSGRNGSLVVHSGSGTRRAPVVITAAVTRSSSKLATHTRMPTNPARR